MDNKDIADRLNALAVLDSELVQNLVQKQGAVTNINLDLEGFNVEDGKLSVLDLISGLVGGVTWVQTEEGIQYVPVQAKTSANWIPVQVSAFIHARKQERKENQSAKLNSIGSLYCPREYTGKRRWCLIDIDQERGVLRISYCKQQTKADNEYKITYQGHISLGKKVALPLMSVMEKAGIKLEPRGYGMVVSLKILSYDETQDVLELSMRP